MRAPQFVGDGEAADIAKTHNHTYQRCLFFNINFPITLPTEAALNVLWKSLRPDSRARLGARLIKSLVAGQRCAKLWDLLLIDSYGEPSQ